MQSKNICIQKIFRLINRQKIILFVMNLFTAKYILFFSKRNANRRLVNISLRTYNIFRGQVTKDLLHIAQFYAH